MHRKKLTVLMYHSVSKINRDSLTVLVDELEKQLSWISDNYQTITTNDLDNVENFKNPILITFDDAYEDFLRFAYPLLKKHNTKAIVFIPFSYVGKSDLWNSNQQKKIMSFEDLKGLDKKTIELGWHSFAHKKYSEISLAEIEEDLENCNSCMKENSLSVASVFAYPYGAYPKKKKEFENLTNLFKNNNIKYAFRIGNRLNSIPLKNNFLIERIDIKGSDDFNLFRNKLNYGKMHKWFIF